MKKILRAIVLCLIVPAILFCSACGKKKSDDVSTTPTVPPTQNEDNTQQEEVIPSLSNSDAFLLSCDLLNDFCDSESELKASYSVEIERMISLINTIYEIEELESGLCSKGKVVSDISESADVNRLAKMIFVDNSNDEKVSVSVKMLFGYKDLTTTYDYRFYHFTIDVDKKTRYVEIKTYSDLSVKYGSDDSTGRYSYLSVKGNIGEQSSISKLSYCEFDRSSLIEEVSNETITNNYIKNFEGIVFENGEKTKEYLAAESDLYMSKLNSEQVVLAKESVTIIVSQLRKVNALNVLRTLTNASDLLVPIVNA